MTAQAYIAADGTPQHVIWAEQWLVGGAMLAAREDIPQTVVPEDFHDETLGVIWEAIVDATQRAIEPTLAVVAEALAQAGKLNEVGAGQRLASLCATESAFLYAGKPSLEAHAHVVSMWGERRRRMAELAQEIRDTYEGRVVPAAHRFRGGAVMECVEVPE